ncbi:hypothetical protein YYC_01130 [Plasmodium yoelii 17X]|uniref:Plasmodium variant antigen protein Cir/Yir/Bir n=1 Tax=Plasmodium yoelii 17X TaxID=1323249 RepID=V7PNM8_PLAYE|nr:hypothetical protein YYC_01130 [Plasmodium yoelii 17X]
MKLVLNSNNRESSIYINLFIIKFDMMLINNILHEINCEKFENVWENFPDTLTNNKYHEFETNNFLNSHCDNGQCDTDIKKISAGFFYLLSGFFGDSNLFNFDEKTNNDIFYYIMIWLSYMLNLKENEANNSLQYFYNIDISNQNKYKNSIAGFTDYTSYKDLLDKKKIVNMDIKTISKFYAPFKSLCNMHTRFIDSTSDCTKCLNDANEFAKKYKELNDDSSITNDSSYNKLLSWFPDELDNGKYKFKDDNEYKQYFNKDSYDDIDKINGWCLFLFNKIFMGYYLCEYCPNSNTNAVAYILAWLSYKLHQKTDNGITNLIDFYTNHMQNVKEYKESIKDSAENTTYIELINKNNDFLNINFEYINIYINTFFCLIRKIYS